MKKGKDAAILKSNMKDKPDMPKNKPNMKNPRDLLPATSPYLKNIRETFLIKANDFSSHEINEIKENLILAKPFELFPEWPPEEELKNFSSNIEGEAELFIDSFNQKIIFPKNFEKNFNLEAKWLRPEEYIKNSLLNKEIKISFPNKNVAKLRAEIRDFYARYEIPLRKCKQISETQQNSIEDYENKSSIVNNVSSNPNSKLMQNINENESQSIFDDKSYLENYDLINKKRNSFRDCFKILDRNIDLRITNYHIREETNEEFQRRKYLEAQEKVKEIEKDNRNNKKKLTLPSPNVKGKESLLAKNFIEENKSDEKLRIQEIKPSSLYFLVEPKYNSYLKWVVSILQLLKDLHFCDSQTGKSIVANIYPQKDNFPIISKTGKYWIKLYFMGKPRKIEIDDLIPCNKYEEFIFPRCDKLEEIWPALFTKAILKLHTYKRKSKYAEEVGDLSIIYSLTGFPTEKIVINSTRLNSLERLMLSNENYLSKKKFLACMSWKEEIINTPALPQKTNLASNTGGNYVSNINPNIVNNNSSTVTPKQKVLTKLSSKNSLASLTSNTINETDENTSDPRKTLVNYSSIINPKPNVENKASSTSNFLKFLTQREKNLKVENKNPIAKESSPSLKSRELPTPTLKVVDEFNEDNKINDSGSNYFVGGEFDSAKKTNPFNNNENKDEIPGKKASKKYLDFVSRLKNIYTENKFKGLRSRRASVINVNFKMKDELINSTKGESNYNNINNNISSSNQNNINIQEEKLSSPFRRPDNSFKTSKHIIKYDINIDSIANNEVKNLREDLIYNYIYPILDFFDNKKFNMSRLKPIDLSDIKKMAKDAKTPGIYKQLSKEDKKKYLEKLLELKQKQKELKNKRIEELKKEGRRYYFLKLRNNSIGTPKLDFSVPYTDQEIYMAKKCLENKWDFPPPAYYDEYEANKYNNMNTESCENTSVHITNFLKEEEKENLNNINNEINSRQKVMSKNKNRLEVIEELMKVSGDVSNLNLNSRLHSPSNRSNLKDSKIKEKNKVGFNFNGEVLNTQNNLVDIDDKTINYLNVQMTDPLGIDKVFDQNYFLSKNTEEKAKEVHGPKANKNKCTWNKDVYMNIINHNLKQYETSIEPITRYHGGLWLTYQDFKNNFNFFILMHSPHGFKNKLICNSSWTYNNDIFEYNQEFSVIYLNNFSYYPDKVTNISNSNEDNISSNSNNSIASSFHIEENKNKKACLLILFEPNSACLASNEFDDSFFYANFDLIDSYGKEIQSNIVLNKFYSTYFNENLEMEKNYFLQLKSFFCPFGFNFNVYSDHNIDAMDYSIYLNKFLNYKTKSFKIEHPTLEKNRLSLISKFKIKLLEKTYLRITLNHTDKLSKKFTEMYLYVGKNSHNKKRINFDLNEKLLFEPLPDHEDYILAIVINPPYNILENALDVSFVYDKESARIDLIDMAEPFKICDRIRGNKYGIVFKEFIFANENTFVTLDLKIQKQKSIEMFNSNININIMSQMKSSAASMNLISPEIKHKSRDPIDSEISLASKINNINTLNQLADYHNISNFKIINFFNQEDLIYDNIRMKLKISRLDETIYEEEFFNQITIQNLFFNYDTESYNNAFNLNLLSEQSQNFYSGKNKNSILNTANAANSASQQKEIIPYLLVCCLDLSELKMEKEQLETLEWVLRVYSSDTVLITKDTSKEDSEKFLKDNWESLELGRSEKARKSRLKHLISCKKKAGKILSLDEEHLLLEERPKTVSNVISLQNNENNTNNNVIVSMNLKDTKEKDKKNANDNKKIPLQKTNRNLPEYEPSKNASEKLSSKNVPKISLKPVIAEPHKHKNYFIKTFLNYTHQERVIKKDSLIENEKKIVLDDGCLRQIYEDINKRVETFENNKKSENEDILNKSLISRDNLKIFYKTTNTFRIKNRDNSSQIYKQRDLLRNDLIKLQDCEKAIEDILISNIIDFQNAISLYRESSTLDGLKPKLREKLFHIISVRKEELYKNELKKLTVKDKNIILKYLDDIEENKWFISSDIINKFNELIQENHSKK